MPAEEKSDIDPKVGCPIILLLLAVVGYLIWTFISMIVEDWQSMPSTPAPQSNEMSKEEMMATFINLNGHLCSEILNVSPELSDGGRDVTCREYRDPKMATSADNIVVYKVNLGTESVQLLGRK